MFGQDGVLQAEMYEADPSMARGSGRTGLPAAECRDLQGAGREAALGLQGAGSQTWVLPARVTGSPRGPAQLDFPSPSGSGAQFLSCGSRDSEGCT